MLKNNNNLQIHKFEMTQKHFTAAKAISDAKKNNIKQKLQQINQ